MNYNDKTNIEKWLSLKDIMEYLGVSRESIFNWIETRGMPGHKVGRLWKFKVSEVDDWIRSGGAADKTNAGDDEKDE